MISAVFLGGVLLLGAALVISGSPQPATTGAAPLTMPATPAAGPAAASAPSPTVAAPSSSPSASPVSAVGTVETVAADSVCGLPPGGQDIPAAVPPVAQWQGLGGILVPTSPVYGPGAVQDGVPGCFAHSPTGALFAMMCSIAVTAAPPDQISAAAVVQHRGSRTGLYEQVLGQARAEDLARATMMPSDPRTSQRVAFLGYRFVDYTPARATIAVAIGTGDPLNTASYRPSMLTAVLAWEGGDWRFVYSAETGSTMAPIISPQQYTPWAA